MPGVVTDTQYEADGQTAFIAYQNGVTTAFAYDPDRRWLDEIETGNSGGLLQRLTYTRDAARPHHGRRFLPRRRGLDLRLRHPRPADHGDQLSPGTLTQSFTYALNGNMLSNSALGAYTYPAATAARPHAVLTAGPANLQLRR